MNARIVAITGGIGAGKSVVSDILRAIGYSVYDSDSRAKILMDNSQPIKDAIITDICCEAVNSNGIIDRNCLAREVFADDKKLKRLNDIVHSTVVTDFKKWCDRFSETVAAPLFIETALLYQSGIDLLVDEVWEVVAPINERVSRVMRRNNISESQVLSRIASQDQYISPRRHPYIHLIENDGKIPLLPRVEDLLSHC